MILLKDFFNPLSLVEFFTLYGGGGGGKGGGKGGVGGVLGTVATVVASIAAPEVVAFIAPELTATEAAAVGGAVVGASSAAIQGQDPLKGGIVGAITSPLSQTIGSELTDTVGKTAAQGIGQAASGAVKGLAYGQTPSQALKSGAISGLAGAGGEYASEALGLDPGSFAGQIVKAGTSGVLSNILGGKSGQPSTQPDVTAAPTAAPAATGAGQITPSSSALAQVLKTDMGAPIFGGEKEGKPQKWDEGDLTGSSALREMGSGIV